MALPTTQEWINICELELGRKLPIDLRVRLLNENGGDFCFEGDVWSLFSVLDRSSRKTIQRSAVNILGETKTAREDYGLPDGDAVVASSSYGAFMFLQEGLDAFFVQDIDNNCVREVEPDFNCKDFDEYA